MYGNPRHEKLIASARKQPTRNEFTHIVKIRYDDEKEIGKWDRFTVVFGSCGLLHFLFPAFPYLGRPAAVENGYRRIVTYNNDYILNGMVHTSDTLLTQNSNNY